MRTFAAHDAKHSLHGITVVVETDGPELFVGRCDDIDERGVHLRDADRHDESDATVPRTTFLARAQALGVWPNLRRVTVPADRVRRVTRLAEFEEATQ
ncbi:MAG: hypothetical protein AB7P46_13880 [Thermoanaerobaculia bacterium]